MLVHVEEGGAESATLATDSNRALTSHVGEAGHSDGVHANEKRKKKKKKSFKPVIDVTRGGMH